MRDRLSEIGHPAEIKIIKTQGDRIQHLSFDKMEGKGFFTKEIEAALHTGEIDLAVHSHKDLETAEPEGLTIAAVSDRANPSDLLLIRKECHDGSYRWPMMRGSIVGTSSARRKSQVLEMRPDVTIKDLRGNVPTRIGKLRDGQYDAILCARAGVDRLNLDLSDLHVLELDPIDLVPAPAQGVLALQVRSGDKELQKVIGQLNDEEVETRIGIERDVLRSYGGGCQVPLGAYCVKDGDAYHLTATVADAWNAHPRRIVLKSTDPGSLSREAIKLLKKDISGKKVWITKWLDQRHMMRRASASWGFELTEHPLIQIEAVDPPEDNLPDNVGWVFFSSPNAVRLFFHFHASEAGRFKYACLGAGTAKALRYVGFRPDFIGESPDVETAANEFGKLIGDQRVLFPMSERSQRTVQRVLGDERVIDWIIYKPVSLHDEVEGEFDAIVVTSPSNAESLSESRKTDRVIAIGPTTAEALRARGFDPYVAESPQRLDRAVWEVL